MPVLRYFTIAAVLLWLISARAFAGEQLTPAEKNFAKAFADHVGPIWHANMESHNRQLVPGTVRVQFSISPKGKLVETRVLSNTSNQLAAQLSIDAIRRAKIPPIPKGLIATRGFSSPCTFEICQK
ncbi:MAG TPA: energy transducer TonB [Chthoniobacterales bacterium]